MVFHPQIGVKMEKNRKILTVILIFLMISMVLSLVQINSSINKNSSKQKINGIPVEFAPGIGVLRVSGVISSASAGGFSQKSMHEAVIDRINFLMTDDNIKAVVMRVDSPGGTVAATQEIYQKLLELRKKKPVVVSMGDLAASGGYYISSAANYIYANQGTMTGSIGVIISAPNFKGLMEKLGIRMNVIKSGKYKDILSSSRDLSEDEKALLQELIDNCYGQFLKDVSLGRNIPIDDFKQFADGRIFTGSRGTEIGLIDGVGTFSDAVRKAGELADLPDGSPLYDETSSPFDILFSGVTSLSKNNFFDSVSGAGSGILEYRYVP